VCVHALLVFCEAAAVLVGYIVMGDGGHLDLASCTDSTLKVNKDTFSLKRERKAFGMVKPHSGCWWNGGVGAYSEWRCWGLL
jgi:hypothetical protein